MKIPFSHTHRTDEWKKNRLIFRSVPSMAKIYSNIMRKKHSNINAILSSQQDCWLLQMKFTLNEKYVMKSRQSFGRAFIGIILCEAFWRKHSIDSVHSSVHRVSHTSTEISIEFREMYSVVLQ